MRGSFIDGLINRFHCLVKEELEIESDDHKQITIKKLLIFFIPLGFSASIVTFSHVIINSTLARAEQAEFVIACYAIAMSIFTFTERAGVLLRQTCSALVKDKITYKRMLTVSYYLISFLFILSSIIAFTQVGNYFITIAFGIDANMAKHVNEIYRILIFVTLFSAFRCFYQGIIISNGQTKWLTIGMIARLSVMYGVSLVFIATGYIDGTTGSYLFLIGMMIECAISMWEGRSIAKALIHKKDKYDVTKKQMLSFYFPLMISTFFTVLVGPSINVFLGKVDGIELAIASYSVALSVILLNNSFFSYMHQIVLNFYLIDAKKIIRFSALIGLIPTISLLIFCFTQVGPLFMEHVMGLNERLIEASIQCMKIFIILTLVFPYLDFLNGLLMLKGQTRFMIISQMTNLLATITVLLISIQYFSYWNGKIGALAQSIGVFSEFFVVSGFFLIGSANVLKDKLEGIRKRNNVKIGS